jgi:hypothetical protein
MVAADHDFIGIYSPNQAGSGNPNLAYIRLLSTFTDMLWNHHPVDFLDEMFTIFDDHSHPVVLIGDQALHWMAVGLMTNEVR